MGYPKSKGAQERGAERCDNNGNPGIERHVANRVIHSRALHGGTLRLTDARWR
jgi:hypothetical protein